MNEYLKQLVDLSQIDKKLDSFTPEIENIQNSLLLKKAEIDETAAAIEKLDKEIEELKSSISQTNAHISEFLAKIKSAGKKSGAVKTEKEMKALSVEEEIAREQLNAANEEIERFEKLIDNKNAQKQDLEEKSLAQNNEYQAMQTSANSKLEEIESVRNGIGLQKEQLTKDMNQKVLSFYNKIRKWAKNTAVVPVKKQACYGCFMRISDKTYSSVIQSDDIVTCPYCGRILYKEID